MKKQARRYYKLQSLTHCPKTPILILHNAQSGRIFLQWINKKTFSHNTNVDIVSLVEFSDFSPYVCFMEERDKIAISAEIISLIGKITRLALSSPIDSERVRFPRELKHEYLKALRYFRSHFYNALYFVAKIRKLVAQLWKHARVYRNFSIARAQYELVTEYCN